MPRPLDDLTRDSVRAVFSDVDTRTTQFHAEDLQLRDSGSGDGSLILEGYAAVFDTPTTLYDGTFFRWIETIDPTAFGNVLATAPDVHLNIGHDMNRAIARTGVRGVGGLQLSTDAHGLRVYARLDQCDPDVAALSAKMRLGIMDQMSFAFRVLAAGITTVTTTDDNGKTTDEDTITEISELFDVCVCAQGAYPTTTAALRSLLGTGARVLNREVARTSDGAQDDPAVAEQTTGAKVDSPSVRRDLARLRAKAHAASSTHRPKENSNDVPGEDGAGS